MESLRGLQNRTSFSTAAVSELNQKMRLALLESDVHPQVVQTLLDAFSQSAAQARIAPGYTADQYAMRLIYNELRQILGQKVEPLTFKATPPAVILLAGLQGVGKTTTSVKLAQHIIKQHRKSVGVCSVDTSRPAAREQLQILASGAGLTYIDVPGVDSVRARALLAQEEAQQSHLDVLLVDTAGRLHADEVLLAELKDLCTALKPAETLLVVDGMAGQSALESAQAFQSQITFSGAIITKLDGDAKGGVVVSLRALTHIPIKLIGVGEKAADLELFHPDRMASRILDMGDLLSLAEKASSTFTEEEMRSMGGMLGGRRGDRAAGKKKNWSLSDFYQQLQQVKKLGSFDSILKFLPGMSHVASQLSQFSPSSQELKKIEAIIQSMTRAEREDTGLLDASRRRRIANGSGTTVEDVNRLVKQFLEARKMMTMFSKWGNR